MAAVTVLSMSDEEEMDSITSGSTVYVNQITQSAYYENVQPPKRVYENIHPQQQQAVTTQTAAAVARKYENVQPTNRTSRNRLAPFVITNNTDSSSDAEPRPSPPVTPSRRSRSQSNEFPELTPPHLINVFFRGITHGQVKTLALLLGVPALDEHTSHPSTYAMETVIEWTKAKPLSVQEQHQVLADHFRRLELNYLIPRLQGKERYTAINPEIIVEFLAAETKYFTVDQAYEFGRLLNINPIKVDTIAHKHRLQRGTDIVIHIFDSFNKESTNLAEPMVESIAKALLKVKASEHQPLNSPLSVSSPQQQEAMSVFEQPQDIQTDGGPANDEEYSKLIKWKRIHKIMNKYKYAWNGIFFVLIILLIISIICLIYLPKLPLTLPKQIIVQSDTIMYTIPNSYWLTSIDIELQGPLKPAECFAKVVSAFCDDIQSEDESTVVSYANTHDYLYLEKNAIISFSLNTNLSESYLAWFFTDYNQAVNSAAVRFRYFACAQPPSNVWCIDLSTTRNYTIPVSNYFFIRCDRGPFGLPNCALIKDIRVTSRNYDLNRTVENYQIDSASLYSSNTATNLQLKESNFYTTQDDVCLLMELDEDNCADANDYDYQIAITRQYRRYDLILYPCLMLALIVAIFIAFWIIKIVIGRMHN